MLNDTAVQRKMGIVILILALLNGTLMLIIGQSSAALMIWLIGGALALVLIGMATLRQRNHRQDGERQR